MIGPPIARLAAAGREGGGGDARIVSCIMNAAFPLLLLEESKRRRKEQKGKFGRSYGNRAAHNIINGGKAVEGSLFFFSRNPNVGEKSKKASLAVPMATARHITLSTGGRQSREVGYIVALELPAPRP